MSLCVEFVSKLADFFDHSVDSLSDDELFAAGYLRGHIDLAIGNFEVDAIDYHREQLIAAVDHSLAQAISNGELSEQDETLVQGLWTRLQH
ncbi:MAG TPA: hypothetical protein DCS87_09360 [Rheinheimera sp.]|nr:hypothetical protein [Rheinheimera sp.]